MKTPTLYEFESGEPLTYTALDGRTIIATVENIGSQFPVRTVAFRQWGKDKPLERIMIGPGTPVCKVYHQILDTTMDTRIKERQTALNYATH